MSRREEYRPGPAEGAHVRKQGDEWTLVLVRELRHPPERVWQALTDPAHLREWAPFDADRNLGAVGPARLVAVGISSPSISETAVTRADPPRTLEYRWGGGDLRWELEAQGSGTRLTLWHGIHRDYVSMGAAGWHIGLDVLDRLLDGTPIGRIVGADALRSDGWRRLNAEYAARFGAQTTQGKEKERP